MQKNQIYIGVYSNGRESVFKKKNAQYYDLKNKKVAKEEIEIDSFVPYTDVINLQHICTKGKVIRLYDIDRCQKISLSRVFIGNLCQVTQTLGEKYYGDSPLTYGIRTNIAYQIVKKDLLLYKEQENFRFLNMINGEYYNDSTFNITTALTGIINRKSVKIGDFFVAEYNEDEIRLFTELVDVSKTSMEKGKILEKYREFKK